MDVTTFLLARSRYRGHFTPENLVFNANLQEFSQRVGLISALESNGKLSLEESYQQISQLWEQLTQSYTQLRIGHSPLEGEK